MGVTDANGSQYNFLICLEIQTSASVYGYVTLFEPFLAWSPAVSRPYEDRSLV